MKDLGKHVEVAAFPNSCAPDLRRAADVFRPLLPGDFDAAGLYVPAGFSGGGRPR